MVSIAQNVSLLHYNTFGIDAKALQMLRIPDSATLQEVVGKKILSYTHWLVLGGGSNILFTKDFDGLILKMEIGGVDVVDESETHVRVKAGSGVTWHALVEFAVEKGWGGIENLALIPGTVGAAPIQNIGAYGVELKDVLVSVEAIEVQTGKTIQLTCTECQFGYRDSIFKRSLKGKVIITSVTIQLSKTPLLNTSYGAIQDVLKEQGKTSSVRSIFDAVVSIRKSKLPDPAVLGNCGSFFKNPEIPVSQFDTLKNAFPNIVGYPVSAELVKVPAGWLIEQTGWKGKGIGNVATHKQQALVIVNLGGATGDEAYSFALKVQADVFAKFGVMLEPEVNLI